MKQWACQRTTAGVKCRAKNPARKRKCQACGKLRPARKKPAHMTALDLTYEQYVELNGSERCGICGAAPKAKRLHRDHGHRSGVPRGLLCFPCNSALRPYMTVEWLAAALEYLKRTEG